MRKWIYGFLCVILLSCLAVPVLAKEPADVTIKTAEEFFAFAENCRLDSYSKGLTVSLDGDIDLSGADFSGIPVFCGNFLGNGHTISGLNITGKGSEQGLFRYLTETAQVENLTVSGKVMPQGSRNAVGGIAGRNAGTIKKCTFTGEISGADGVGGIAGVNTQTGVVKSCSAEGKIYGNHFVGGIVGENAGEVLRCENFAAVNNTPKQNSVDFSDITIGTITGAESVSTVTDIGGIAGTSTGTIRRCENRGDVGYKHMGYNVGGIAGSQNGYIKNCRNYGAVSGRKEVGGIVGHMEPAVLVRYETDTIQILQEQMAVLSQRIDALAANVQSNTAAVQALIGTLEYHVAQAEKAVDTLTIDPEDPELEDWETYKTAVQTLRNSISGINATTRSLYQAMKDLGDDLSKDLLTVSGQMDVIEGILNNAEENLGGTVTDVSDTDTDDNVTSKVQSCQNSGHVLGDLNVGGIVGAMALESDLDPEKDVSIYGETTLNVAGEIRSVVLDCSNYGSVTAKKQNAGGITGWQSLGLVKACINMGILAGGEYTGGIAGQSLGYIRACYAKCMVSGTAYTGGIAGSGTVVTDSRSMVQLSGSERVGAILGFLEENHTQAEQPVLGNIYLCIGTDVGGIDGISYDTQAQNMQLHSFLGMQDLPREFREVTVTFRFEDGTEEKFSLRTGDTLRPNNIPEIPAKEGFSGQWTDLQMADLENMLFDRAYEVLYTSHGSVIKSEESVEGRPVLLLQGDFASDAAVSMKKTDAKLLLTEKETLLETWSFAVSGGKNVTTGRFLMPADVNPETLQLYLKTDGNWSVSTFEIDGSYMVFSLEAGTDEIALVQRQSSRIPQLVICAVAVVVLVAGICIGISRKKKKSAAAQQQVQE